MNLRHAIVAPMYKLKIPKFLQLPTVVELGKSEHNFLPSRRFNKFEKGYCWEDYDKEMKEKYPIRFFINKELRTWLVVHLRMPIENSLYWIESYLIRKDHLIDLRMPDVVEDYYKWGYMDARDKIYFACFRVLKDYIEKEKPTNLREHYSPEEINNDPGMKAQQDCYDEAQRIYRYFMGGRKEWQDRIDALFKKAKSAETEKEADRLMNIWLKETAKFEEGEDEIFVSLMKIRRGLWT